MLYKGFQPTFCPLTRKIQKRENLCFLNDVEDKKAKLDKAKVDAIEQLIKSFLSQAPKEISDAKKLAEALAVRAKLLKDFLLEELKRQEIDHTEGKLYQLYETFKNFVFHELTVGEFSDAFAQNLVYGLFLARLNADTQIINLYNAKKFIPSSFELIRELVHFLDELDNDEYRETRWIVEEVLTIMNNLDLKAIQETLSFTKKHKDANNFTIKDPYVYFYEDFLAAYDKKLRKAKGVYYTPPPVVNFIVRAIDDILVHTFKITDGLADRNKMTILDFATGTGTFLLETLQQIFDKLPKDSGKKDLLIKEHVLKNLFGFEYLIAPYTVAHLKLSQFLKEQGYKLSSKERLQIYLTNTLEPVDKQIKIPLLPALTEETKKAQIVKDKPILVITGNPPYSINSSNTHATIIKLLADYKKGLNERKLNLDDDYIKFIRFAHHKLEDENVEKGIIAIITNNSFYDGINHRKMRESLFHTFNRIYVLNLHGNSRINEKSEDGSVDENVFDITVGVGITILVKDKSITTTEVLYDDLFGDRISKYEQLFSSDIKRNWNKIVPEEPYFLFKPIHFNEIDSEKKLYPLFDIFVQKGSAIKTDRDELFYDFNSKALSGRIKKLLSNELDNEFIEKFNIKNSGSYKILDKIKKIKFDDNSIEPCYYRPFDTRFVYYKNGLTSRPNYELNKHLLKKNICLIIGRAGNVVNQEEAWNLALVTNKIVDTNIFYRGGGFLFPLYLIDDFNNYQINFTQKFNEFIKDETINNTPDEIFGYVYAILYSPSYRKSYAGLLNIDFPKIPFIKKKEIFKQLADLGNALGQVHLLSDDAVSMLKEKYLFGELIGKGHYIVDRVTFLPEEQLGKLYINTTQYFENIPIDVYEFYIGGYQVIDKYLKDRKGRALTLDELDNIKHTAYALAFTIEQMNIIDEITKPWI